MSDIDPETELNLPPVMDLMAAPLLHEQILDRVKQGSGDLVLSAVAVERVTTPCVQVLLAAAKSLDEAGAQLKIIKPTEAFLDAMKVLGLEEQSEIWCDNYG